MDDLVALQSLSALQAADDGHVDDVLVVRPRRQRGVEDHLIG
jgi:hypothetical protein